MADLERRLEALRHEIAWPETPVLRPTLEPQPRGRRPGWVLAVGAAVVLATLAAMLALSPGARSAFREIFRIRGATVEHVDRLPETTALRLDFGQRVSRETAERRARFDIVDLGVPDATYLRDGRIVSLLYGSPGEPRLLLTELRGGIWDGLVKKVAGSGTHVEAVDVGGETGLFITGDDHFVAFLDANGSVRSDETYLAGTVLLWNRGGLLLRLEGDLTRAEAVALAKAVE